MKELKDILKAYDAAIKAAKQTALATVVLVEGSAYRRAGARMLITEDGELTGAISGGCLEGDALRKARLAMAQQQPMLVTYDTMDDDDAKLGVGLGCNGIIHILIEPIHTDDVNNPLALIKLVLSKRQNAVLVTLFSVQNRKAAQPGTCFLLTGEGQIKSTMGDESLKKLINSDAERVLDQGASQTKTYFSGTEFTGFVELIKPAISLIIIGAGNDAMPLTQMAAVLGWETTVVDGRPNYALTERFPQATRVLVSKPEQACTQLTFDGDTVMVLMTHNYNYELALLKHVLPLNLIYLGILGPKKKLERLLGELEDSGTALSEQQLNSIYGPVGLDIGSEGAEEIALSIVAEIKAVLSHRNGKSLKYKAATIHTIAP
jgi:xanthine/CO dehydrogenase XdhC/CoxF family maturation factor